MRIAGKTARDPRSGIVDVWRREVGFLAPRAFARRYGASEDLVLRLGIHRKLKQHTGCVNCISFNANGNILVSGSDDKKVILWDWETGFVKLSFSSGHKNNIFQARFMPSSDDRTIVTCAADGEVRLAVLQDGGYFVTTLLAKHDGRAHKIAIKPGSPHIFYSCSEDGLVQHFDLRTRSATKLFKCQAFQEKSFYMPIVHLNAIAIDPANHNLFAIAGSEEFARVYDIRKCRWDGKSCRKPVDCFCPLHLIGENEVEITGLAFSEQSELLVSYNGEQIYLFSKRHGLGPDPLCDALPHSMDMDDTSYTNEKSIYSSKENLNFEPEPEVYRGHSNRDTVKGVSFYGPHCEYVASGSDCGRIFIWRKKGGELLRVMEADKYVVNCIEPHPWTTTLASSGIEHDIKIWIPNAVEPASPVDVSEVMLIYRGDSWFASDGSDYDDSDDYNDEEDDDNDDDVDDDSDIDATDGSDEDGDYEFVIDDYNRDDISNGKNDSEGDDNDTGMLPGSQDAKF
ncbi:Guanine nucleotide-binding protein subunit beta-like protein B [Apostasia shenzhenica]|uniref:Guanine nucleotide-binding protein subunit beta-like protein B n=1 Tax=Apostasia shenzhenica TaxID=1088818 RepID=A0A2I0AZ01_9ASPA|nr:Guanine nucleotide-binding protein subunit beta-like protein B [Apostasia shenzhenica]